MVIIKWLVNLVDGADADSVIRTTPATGEYIIYNRPLLLVSQWHRTRLKRVGSALITKERKASITLNNAQAPPFENWLLSMAMPEKEQAAWVRVSPAIIRVWKFLDGWIHSPCIHNEQAVLQVFYHSILMHIMKVNQEKGAGQGLRRWKETNDFTLLR